MHDSQLLHKLSLSLKDICGENKIDKIEKLTIIVNHNSHIDAKYLLEHLKLLNKDLVTQKTFVELLRDDIEDQTAVIQSIQGVSAASTIIK